MKNDDLKIDDFQCFFVTARSIVIFATVLKMKMNQAYRIH